MNAGSLTSITVALLAVSLLATMPAQQQAALAQTDAQGIEMTVMADEGSDTIMVMGTIVKSMPTDITFTVTSPNGLNVVSVDQVTPDGNGVFETSFVIDPTSQLWKADGLYTVTASGGISAETSQYRVSLPVMIVGGAAQSTAMTDGNLERLVVYDMTASVQEPTGITIEATGEIGSNTIMVTGMTDKLNEDITLTVTAPNGNVVTVEQATANLDGVYDAIIITGGNLWKSDGMYTVTAQQNNDPLYTASAEVDIADGVVVPEFGTIAAMILAVAIVSVIVVSARSRLSIVAGQ